MCESDVTLRPDSGVVWPAVKQLRGHIGQQFAAHRFAVEPADSGYSAHMTSASIVPAFTPRPDKAGDPGATSLLDGPSAGPTWKGWHWFSEWELPSVW